MQSALQQQIKQQQKIITAGVKWLWADLGCTESV